MSGLGWEGGEVVRRRAILQHSIRSMELRKCSLAVGSWALLTRNLHAFIQDRKNVPSQTK